jgi:tetratricopeptide (TPR) repeat protein
VSDSQVLAHVDALLDAHAYEQAVRMIGDYLAANPGDVEALCLAARAEIGRGNPAQAYGLAANAAALEPGNEWPARLISVALIQQGQFVAAVQAAQEAVRLEPAVWQTHYQLAAARYRVPRGARLALVDAQQALRLAPDQPSVHRLMGTILGSLRRTRAARGSFAQALRLDPHDAIARHELARLSLRRGNLIGAARGFGQAVALDPSLEVGVRNLDLVIVQVLRFIVLVLFVASLAWSGDHLDRGIHLGIVIALTLVIVSGLSWFWYRAGARLGNYIRALPRREPMAVLVGVLALLCLVCLWLAALAPTASQGANWASASHVGAAGGLIVLFIWLRRRRSRSTH